MTARETAAPVLALRSGRGQPDGSVLPGTAAHGLWWWRAMETGITGTLLLTAALAVANSIVAANWVADMPDLYVLALLAVSAAVLLAVSPLHWSLALLVGVLAGAVLVLWQVLTVESVAGQLFFFDRFEDLWFRLEDWFRQAFNSGITTDNLPFILFVASAMWLATFLGALAFLRGRNPWVFLILLGIMLAVNVSYVRGQQWDINFAIFVGTGALLIMRSGLLRRMDRWRADGTRFPDFISLAFLGASIVMIVVLLGITRALPRPDNSGALASVWDGVQSPFGGLGDDFARLFGGIDSQRGAPIHSFRDSFVLQGDIDPGDSIVLRVDAPEPGLLRGASYDRYTSRGWQQTDTVTTPLAEGLAIAGDTAPEYRGRREVGVRLSVERSPQVLFSFGQPLLVDRAVGVEVSGATQVEINFAESGVQGIDRNVLGAEHAPALRELLQRQASGNLTPAEARTLIPESFVVTEVVASVKGRGLTSITLESRPLVPDVLALEPPDRLRSGATYRVTGSVSMATVEALRGADATAPLWVRDRFLQLPQQLTDTDLDRINALAAAVAGGSVSAYDAAAAIEGYLCCTAARGENGQAVLTDEGDVQVLYPFTTALETPPFDADSVAWFLFDNLDDAGLALGGYYDYHASAMAVLLRTLGIPARVSTGFVLTPDNLDARTGTYIVRGRHAYAWVEVFFPEFGWVDFDPTPSVGAIVNLVGVGGERLATQRLVPFRSDVFDGNGSIGLEEFEELLALILDDLNTNLSTEEGGGTTLWWIYGPLVALGVLVVLIGTGWTAWQVSLRGQCQVERAWTATQRLGGWSGFPSEPSVTPNEYATVLGAALAEPEAPRTLAWHYGRVRFGRKALQPEEAEDLRRAWQRLRGRLLRHCLCRSLPKRPGRE